MAQQGKPGAMLPGYGSKGFGLGYGGIEVHGDEHPHLEPLDKLPGTAHIVAAQPGVDRKHRYVETGDPMSQIVEFGPIGLFGLTHLVCGRLVVPMPVVQIAGVENRLLADDDLI